MNSNMNQYSSEMLASSIMLMSICEHSEIHPGYKPATLTPSNSEGSLPGWGNSMTRRSYKTNLCSLADQQEQQEQQQHNQHHEPQHKQRFLENCASPQQPKRTRTTTTNSSTTGWFR